MLKKGQTLIQVILWAGGFTLTGIGLASSIIVPKINAQDERIYNHETRLTATEIRVERLPVIEAKVDKLLESQGINPDKIR